MGFRERFVSDVSTMLVVLDLIQIMHAKFAFKWVLTELRDTLAAELDFEQAAILNVTHAWTLPKFFLQNSNLPVPVSGIV